ncbi:MAG: FKBP-type peptidyl-prolyl cis-trans isomerase N-terminal domain-containing protein, partial [Prevotellaceae bacterium]|nr:FKBP-type peptidyl-prolyl cis-trans isomerase N-terminal domain-containing protein [Prevotellaceae bacterium]
MKKTFFLFATAILVTFSACNNFKTTAVLSSDLDSLNYAFGVIVGNQYLKPSLAEDTTKANYKAYLTGFNKGFDSVPETEIEKVSAIFSGIQLRETLKEGFIFDDSTFVANKKLIEKTVFEVLAGKDSINGLTAQSAQQFYFKIYRQQRDTIKHELTAEQLDSLNVAFAIMQGGRAIARVDSAKKADFVKNYKKGYSIKSKSGKYSNLGFLVAASNYKPISAGLEGKPELPLNAEIFKAGVAAALLGDTTIFTFEKAAMYYQTTITEKLFGKNKTEGEQFLSENGKREGV